MDVQRVVRAMMFIDGNNLFHSSSMIGKPKGIKDSSIRIKFRALPLIFGNEVNKHIPEQSVYVTATHYVASIPVNYSPDARPAVEKQARFLNWIQDIPMFQVRLMEIDFHGHPVRRREDSELFEPKESKVDMEVAALMLQHCYQDDYEIAILVAGDSDYAPALSRIISKGKQVALFGIRNSCSQEFAVHNPSLTTWPVFWIDDLPEVYFRAKKESEHEKLETSS